ncbi:MAG: hypothetical protein ACYDCK_05020 [Thermoplasmatota archaeon]
MNTHNKMVKYGIATAFLALAALASSPLATAQAGIDAAGTLSGAAHVDSAVGGILAQAQGVADTASNVDVPVNADAHAATDIKGPDAGAAVSTAANAFADLGSKVKSYVDGIVGFFSNWASTQKASTDVTIQTTEGQADANVAGVANATMSAKTDAVSQAQGAANGALAQVYDLQGKAYAAGNGALSTASAASLDASAHLDTSGLTAVSLPPPPSPPSLPTLDSHMGFFAELTGAFSGLFHMG